VRPAAAKVGESMGLAKERISNIEQGISNIEGLGLVAAFLTYRDSLAFGVRHSLFDIRYSMPYRPIRELIVAMPTSSSWRALNERL
jgi:hypothetical protein